MSKDRQIGRPNILLIVTDAQPHETGWATRKISNWIAGRGVNFANGFVTTPLCLPSRASIFTGRYAHNHGVLDNRDPHRLDQRSTVQHYLRRAGYRTGLYGKYLSNWNVNNNPPHFDEFALQAPAHYHAATYNVNGAVQPIPGYSTHVIRDRALEFLRRGATDRRPWFLYVAPNAPRVPCTPEARYAAATVPLWGGRPSVFETDKSDKPAYLRDAAATLTEARRTRRQQLRVLFSVDDAVQAIHDELAALGQLDNTLVCYVSDNGFCWADHGWIGTSVPYRPAIRVPCYLSWPAAGLGAGTIDHDLVATIDIAPTILDAAGITPDARYPQDGRSLLRAGRRDHLLIEFWTWVSGGPPAWASYLSPTVQYVEYYDLRIDPAGRPVGGGEVLFREYYDRTRDLYQLRNLLFQSTPEDEEWLGVPALAARLARDRRCGTPAGAGCP